MINMTFSFHFFEINYEEGQTITPPPKKKKKTLSFVHSNLHIFNMYSSFLEAYFFN